MKTWRTKKMSKVRVEFTTDEGLKLSQEYDLDLVSGDEIGEAIRDAEEFLNNDMNLKVAP